MQWAKLEHYLKGYYQEFNGKSKSQITKQIKSQINFNYSNFKNHILKKV